MKLTEVPSSRMTLAFVELTKQEQNPNWFNRGPRGTPIPYSLLTVREENNVTIEDPGYRLITRECWFHFP